MHLLYNFYYCSVLIYIFKFLKFYLNFKIHVQWTIYLLIESKCGMKYCYLCIKLFFKKRKKEKKGSTI